MQLISRSLVFALALGAVALNGQMEAQKETPQESLEPSQEQYDKALKSLDYSSDVAPESKSAQPNRVPESEMVEPKQMEKATEGLDYSDDVEGEQKPKKKQVNEQNDSGTGLGLGLSKFIQVFVIGVLLLLVVAGIYYIAQGPRNKHVHGVYDIAIEKIEEHLHETDLMRYLREALAQKDFAVAVRLYHLQTLKDLSASGHIKWAKGKTNRNYMNELSTHALHSQVTKNTQIYETVWFGKTTMTEAGFRAIEPYYRAVLKQTGNSLNVNA